MVRAVEFEAGSRRKVRGDVAFEDGISAVSSGIQNARVAIQAVGHRRQFIAQAIIQSQLTERLPVIENKETIAPLANRPFYRKDRSL